MKLNIVAPDYNEEWKKAKERYLKHVDSWYEDVKRYLIFHRKSFTASVCIVLCTVICCILAIANPSFRTWLSGVTTGINWLDTVLFIALVIVVLISILRINGAWPAKRSLLENEYNTITSAIREMDEKDDFNEARGVFEQFADTVCWSPASRSCWYSIWSFFLTDGFIENVRSLEKFQRIEQLSLLKYEMKERNLVLTYETLTGVVETTTVECSVEQNTKVDGDSLIWRNGNIVFVKKYLPEETVDTGK